MIINILGIHVDRSSLSTNHKLASQTLSSNADSIVTNNKLKVYYLVKDYCRTYHSYMEVLSAQKIMYSARKVLLCFAVISPATALLEYSSTDGKCEHTTDKQTDTQINAGPCTCTCM